MKNLREKLVEGLRNAGMAENQADSNMKQFDELGWFYCALNHLKAMELQQFLKKEQECGVQLYGEVNGGWIHVHVYTKVKNFNRTHPETRTGEVFLTNISMDNGSLFLIFLIDRSDTRSDWERIGWKTKRKGIAAYDIYGKPIVGMLPVFVQQAELEKAGIIPTSFSLF